MAKSTAAPVEEPLPVVAPVVQEIVPVQASPTPAPIAVPSASITEYNLSEEIMKSIPVGSILGITEPKTVIATLLGVAESWKDIVEKKHWYVMIEGKNGKKTQHVYFEGWQMLNLMLGCTLREEYVAWHSDPPGWEASMLVIRARDGMVIGKGSGFCGNDEPRWKNAPVYAQRSMSITRAGSKASRELWGVLAKLAGYEPTPAEEMTDLKDFNITTGEPIAGPAITPETESFLIRKMKDHLELVGKTTLGLDRKGTFAIIQEVYPGGPPTWQQWDTYIACLEFTKLQGKNPTADEVEKYMSEPKAA